MSSFFLPIVIGFIFFALYGVIFIVKQQTAAVIETFGRFSNIRQSGFQLKVPVVQRIAGRMSLKIQQLDVIIETKTLDDVFVKLKVSVQFKVIKDKVYEAFYKLDYPHDQITSYVFDVVRAEVPKMKLDDVFVKKDDIAIAREKTAAQYEGDAARILIVEKAKAEAESKRLQGQGIADQRREIARGLEESVEVLNKVGINSQEASASGSQMLNDMVASFTASNQIGEAMKKNKKNLDK